MTRHTPLRRPREIKISSICSLATPNEKLFSLHTRYSDSETWQHYWLVHIPYALRTFFEEGKVKGLYLQELERGSASSQALHGHPHFVVLGVELHSGRHIECVPEELKALYRKSLWQSCGLLVAGALAVFTPAAWLGGLVFGLGLSRWKQARQVPHTLH